MSETGTVLTQNLSYIRAVNAALRWGLESYSELLVFGEDVGIPGGPFGSTKGLREAFGDRVFDTPISESAIIGAAIGAAMRGRRPVIEIMWTDFTLVAMDQLVNQLPNIHYISRGGFRVPVTVRMQQGQTPGSCAQHSQSLEAIFAHVPGLRVGLPANPQDAYDMLRSAIVSDDPVLIIESRALYQDKADVVTGGPVAPIGGARVLRQGSDLTLVSWARMVQEAVAAADLLAERGISVEVIDLRWLSPFDYKSIVDSVSRTGRLAIVHEANVTGGFGAEVAARVASEAWWSMEAPVLRIGTPDVRMPAAPTLQQALVPNAGSIAEAVMSSLAN